MIRHHSPLNLDDARFVHVELLWLYGLCDELKTRGLISGGRYTIADDGQKEIAELRRRGFAMSRARILELVDRMGDFDPQERPAIGLLLCRLAEGTLPTRDQIARLVKKVGALDLTLPNGRCEACGALCAPGHACHCGAQV